MAKLEGKSLRKRQLQKVIRHLPTPQLLQILHNSQQKLKLKLKT